LILCSLLACPQFSFLPKPEAPELVVIESPP
jgi:hypothetical protein